MTTSSDIERRISLRGAALAAMRCRDDEVLLCGPAGTGKSFVALLKVHIMMLANPGAKALVVRKTHRSLTQTGLVTFREQVLPEALATGICRWYGGSGSKPAGFVYGNGSFVAVGGLDDPLKIMSSEYDLIYVQEATDCTVIDWELMSSRLRNGVISFQQLLADCNPQQPSHWLHKRTQDGKTTLLTSVHEDNPRLFDDAGQLTPYGTAYIKRLDALTGVRYLRLRKGLWAAAEGIVFADWRPEVHLIDPPADGLPAAWRRIWTVDFGFVHAFVWQQWAIDDDGRLYLEKEIHRTQRIVADHARDIKEVAAGVRPQLLICDHDAEDRATLERELGMGSVPARKGVSDGIQAFQARLRDAGDGRARMFVLRDSLVSRDESLVERGKPTCFAEEIEGYVWSNPPRPSGGVEKNAKDAPLKIDDDSMDAARYAVANEDLRGNVRVRWLG